MFHKGAPFLLWLELCNTCSQVTSRDNRNFSPSASNTTKSVVCKAQCCLITLIPFTRLVYHPKLAHDLWQPVFPFPFIQPCKWLFFLTVPAPPYYPLGTEKLPVPLTWPFPSCTTTDLLFFSSLLLFLLTAVRSHCEGNVCVTAQT